MNDLGFWKIVIMAAGIGLMLLLNIRYKINGLVALLLASLFVGILEGLGLVKLVATIQNGFGSTLGSLALIVVFGAVLGRLMVDCGASHQIASTLLRKFGRRYVEAAVILIGMIFGIGMFYEVAFIILAPLVITIAVDAKIPFLKLVIPAVAAATTTHSLFPPQPGPVALVDAYHADMGMVFIYGIIVAVPSVVCAGLILPRFLGNLDRPVPALFKPSELVPDNELPSFRISILVPLIPAIIIMSGTVLKLWMTKDTPGYTVVNFISSATISMLIAVLVAFSLFGTARGRTMEEVMKSFDGAVKAIAMVVLIIGAGGAFKQVILDSGVGDYIAKVMSSSLISPLILAWIITVSIRLATGSGVVSAITAAGIVGPLMVRLHVNPALMVLATASGSNTLTHVNDAAFWLFKGYFDLSIKDTFKTWGLLELTNSVVGLLMVLLLSLFV